ncbi:MAG: transcriptional regulator [Chloroflexi bacterium]|jgi:DNA-binding transcriptional ArsR family regulator|nr:transcriptional regulator [Chloroflexota bacterium]
MTGDVFAVISEPRRRQILRLLQNGELSAGEIAAHFEVTRPAISQHLKVLEDARLVAVRQDGTKRLYRARPEGLNDLRAFLDEFWGANLDALKQAAESYERGIEPNGHSRQ